MFARKEAVEVIQNLEYRMSKIEELQKLTFPKSNRLYQCNDKFKENFVNGMLEFYGFIRSDLNWCDLYSFNLKKGIDYNFLDKNNSQEILDFIECKNKKEQIWII